MGTKGGVPAGALSDAGDALNGSPTYMWDRDAAVDLADGVANRGDADFAMLIWDFGAEFDSMRMYTHQDHYSGGLVTDPFVAQDLMEYSVWGSNDGDNFVLLSDVTAFDMNGDGVGLPTYSFTGTAPSNVYRGGSEEFGITNAYTREYEFSTAYRYYGIRTSTISLNVNDADPELDAIAAFNKIDRAPEVPEPGSVALVGLGIGVLVYCRRRVVAA
jgi:hypothetical protein